MIVMTGRDHVGAYSRSCKCSGNGSGEPNRVEAGMNRQGNKTKYAIERQVSVLGVFPQQDQGYALGLSKSCQGFEFVEPVSLR